ncbi:MAG: C40 family peptidase [Oscillospiraceae bacterium]|nr:C40 family peptidase [Oscillospiraceae bacterium]
MIFKRLRSIAAASVLIGVLACPAHAAGFAGALLPPVTAKLFTASEALSSVSAVTSVSLETVRSDGSETANYTLGTEDSQPVVFVNLLELNSGLSNDKEAEKGGQVAETAMKYLGTPYVWGGSSEHGFDCSGFVQYVYRECGYTVDRTAADIYKNGIYVEKEDLQIGDAICFSSHTESIGHVGIYIGNGQFIHASSGSGCVIISGLDEDYYAQRYVGARRII